MADWRVCPYQRFFEEYSKNKLKETEDSTQKITKLEQDLHIASEPPTKVEKSRCITPKLNENQLQSELISNLSPASNVYGHNYNRFVYMSGTLNNSSETLDSPASSIGESSFHTEELSPLNDYQKRSCFKEDYEKGNLSSASIGGFCDEPDELEPTFDAKNRPKLQVLTTFLGGF